MAARKDLKTKVEATLTRRAHDAFRNGAKVRVERSDYRDYLHTYVTSKKFEGMSSGDRAALIWKWLEEDLTPTELVKITLVLPLTPQEERDLLGVSS